jgi:hypothetical protein
VPQPTGAKLGMRCDKRAIVAKRYRDSGKMHECKVQRRRALVRCAARAKVARRCAHRRRRTCTDRAQCPTGGARVRPRRV